MDKKRQKKKGKEMIKKKKWVRGKRKGSGVNEKQ